MKTKKKSSSKFSIQQKSDFFRKFNGVDFILTRLFVLALIALSINWIIRYRREDGNLTISQRISGMSENDSPWLPPGFTPKAIFGVHHFGDWELMSAYSQSSEPYNQSYPAITPPVGLFVTRILSTFGVGVGFLLCTIITWAMLFYLLRVCTQSMPSAQKAITGALVSVLSLPFMVNFDRGSVVLTSFLIVGIGLYAFSTKRWNTSIVCMVLAMSFKPYLVFFLVLPLALKQYRFVIKAIGGTVILNTLTLYILYSNSSVLGFYHYFQSISFYQNIIESPILRSVSVLSFIVKIISTFENRASALDFYQTNLKWYVLITFLVFLIGYILSKQKTLSFEMKVVLLFSLSAMLVSNAMFYTLTWTTVGFLFWIKQLSTKDETSETKVKSHQNVSIFVLFAVVMSPNLLVFKMQSPLDISFLAILLYVPLELLMLCTFFQIRSKNEIFYQQKNKNYRNRENRKERN